MAGSDQLVQAGVERAVGLFKGPPRHAVPAADTASTAARNDDPYCCPDVKIRGSSYLRWVWPSRPPPMRSIRSR